MHSIDSRLVTGPSNILFAGVYVCTFPPGNFTDWGSERVNFPLGWLKSIAIVSVIMMEPRTPLPSVLTAALCANALL